MQDKKNGIHPYRIVYCILQRLDCKHTKIKLMGRQVRNSTITNVTTLKYCTIIMLGIPPYLEEGDRGVTL